MPGPEGIGPSPEEQGVTPEAPQPSEAPTPPEAAPAEPETPSSAPEEKAEEKKSWRDKLAEKLDRNREKRRTEKEKAEVRKNIARARERRIKGYAEIIKHGARTPQELQDLLADISFKELKEAQDRVKYGGSALGKLKAFMAGERDFEINDDQAVREYYKTLNDLRLENNGAEPTKQQHAERMGISVEQLEQIHLIEGANILVESGRRLASTFLNKRTAISAGAYVGLGLLTGGFGWAAGGVLLGGVAGRGTAELGELAVGRTREARESVLYAEKARWERMQALALQIRSSKEDAVTQGALTKELIDLMYRQGENVLVRNLAENEKELTKREEKFNKFRNRLQTAGEVVGGVAGLGSILNGGVEHLDMDFFNKVDGQSVFHGVQQTESGWQFLYSSGAEAGLANAQGATILAGGEFGAHALEATTSQVVAYTVAERTLPILLASQFASIDHRRTGEVLAKVHHRNISPDRYYTKPGPDGKRFIYTREEDGTYKRWEWQESEEKKGEKTKKVRKLVGTTVEEKDVPKKFVERFIDGESTQDSRNAERLTNQMTEYIRKVADETHNPIPKNPREFDYDWNEQPKVIDDLEAAKIDRWYQFLNVNGKDEPRVDPETGRIVEVGVLGVDVINNRIAYARFERASNGTEHVPVEIMRLDQFLKGFHLHLDSKAGSPVTEYRPDQNAGEDIIDAEYKEITDDEESEKPENAPATDKDKQEDSPEETTASPEKPSEDAENRPVVGDANNEISEAFLKGFYGEDGKNESDRQTNDNKEKKTEPLTKEKKEKVDWPQQLELLIQKLSKKFSAGHLAEHGIIIQQRKLGWVKGINEKGYPMSSLTLYKKGRKGSYGVESMRLIFKDDDEPVINYGHYGPKNRWVDERPSAEELQNFFERVASISLPDEAKSNTEEPISDYDQEIPVPINQPKAEVVEKEQIPEGFVEARQLLLSDIEEGDKLLIEQPDEGNALRHFNTLAKHVGQEGKYVQIQIVKIKNNGVVRVKTKGPIPYDIDYSGGVQPMVIGRMLRTGENEKPTVLEDVEQAADDTHTSEAVSEVPTGQPGTVESIDSQPAVVENVGSEPTQPDPEISQEAGIVQLLERAGKTLEDFRVGAEFRLKEPVAPEDQGIVEDILKDLYPDGTERPSLDDIVFEVYEEPNPVAEEGKKPEDYLITFIANDAAGNPKENSLPLSALLKLIK
jgi:hypothetical protein